MKKDQKEAIKALINLLVSVYLEIDQRSLKKWDKYFDSLHKFCTVFKINQDKLEFILDLFTGDPTRIFGFFNKNSAIDIQKCLASSQKETKNFLR